MGLKNVLSKEGYIKDGGGHVILEPLVDTDDSSWR